MRSAECEISYAHKMFVFVPAQEIIKVSAASEDEEKINRRVRRDRRALP